MTAYFGSSKIKDTGAYGVYLGSQNTNCLTYTPKNIDLELNDGTLTLKAGSKVYVPNGVGVFNAIDIKSDLLVKFTSDRYGFLYYYNGDLHVTDNMGRCVSGNTDSLAGLQWHVWYDTANNIIKRYTSDATTPAQTGMSLPMAIITISNGAISSIDQIFDWCGYIGTAIFRLPDVIYNKGDGLNNDGTYKITKYTSSSVVVREQTWNVNGTLIDWGNKLEVLDSKGLLEVEDALPTAKEGIWERCYVKSENKWYSHSNTSLTWNEIPSAINKIADCSIDVSTQTTTLTPYTAQPEMTVIPVNTIYNGSDLVYQYHPYDIGYVILYGANTGTMTYTLPKGVYQCCVVGGGWKNQASWSKAGGAAAEIKFRLTTTATVVVSSGGLGVDGYLNINGVRVVTARTPTIEQGGDNTYSIDTSSPYYVSTVYASDGKDASLATGASVSPYEKWGSGTQAGGARLAYVGT